MAIATRPPQTPSRRSPSVDAPRRWPIRLLLAVALAGLIVASVAFVWLARYQPLASDGGTRMIRPYRLVTASSQATDPDGRSFTESQIRMLDDVRYRVEFPVTNTGPLPIRIDGLAVPDASPDPTVAVSLVGTTSPDARAQNEIEQSFAPFTLATGETRYLFVDIRFHAHAFLRGTSATMVSTALATTTAGVFHDEADVSWGMTVDFCRPPCTPPS